MKHKKARLRDDRTLDTVIFCVECGQEERFTFMPQTDEDSYDDFVEWCLDEFEDEHECEEDE